VRGDRVAVAPAVALAHEVSRVDQLSDDPVGGALRDADLLADLPQPGIPVARDAEQNLAVVAEESPIGHFGNT
jgi:hypothetical protein